MTGLAILRRDLFVTGREFPVFLAQVILQPLFLLFVFGKVLTELGYARPGYEQVLFPGLVALAAVLTGLQSTALPLVIEFSYSNEIEDRLLAPLPTGAVAVEKVVFARHAGVRGRRRDVPGRRVDPRIHPVAGVDRSRRGGHDRVWAP